MLVARVVKESEGKPGGGINPRKLGQGSQERLGLKS